MGKAILKAPLVSVEAMDAEAFFKRSKAARVKWYCSTLCAYQEQLFESSRRNNVPAQLIAACILNELADIKFQDVWQERLGAIKGSLGPAQMQVQTATEFGHVDVPQEVLERDDEAKRLQPGPHFMSEGYAPPPPRKMLLRAYVAMRLKIMQVSIEAAARELARLLTLMAKHKTRAWQQQHGFNAPAPAVAPHPHACFQQNSFRGVTDNERFEQLCDSVIAAYNSPDIIIAMNPGKSVLFGGASGAPPYLDARQHGFNGATIGWDIFTEGLFVQRP
ncbi:hypothetical protein BO221_42135 [Archangium sp. Cb G35]|nr:hypothetical protein BO221_42135 [Archangium sp. Cb G35]